jgi:hypothetical protein
MQREHGQGNIQSVKRMKDSAEQKINRRERAGGMKMGKKRRRRFQTAKNVCGFLASTIKLHLRFSGPTVGWK